MTMCIYFWQATCVTVIDAVKICGAFDLCSRVCLSWLKLKNIINFGSV
jgi:hypothetical protein